MGDAGGTDRPRAGDGAEQAQIRTFLIADVRGYTLFTQERGDEAAAKLAAKFADTAREIVEGRGGTLLELRGDETLCVFASTREVIRAAVEILATREVTHLGEEGGGPPVRGAGLGHVQGDRRSGGRRPGGS